MSRKDYAGALLIRWAVTYFLLTGFCMAGDRLPFIMDMMHQNPGEAPFDTKWSDPGFVKSQGFDAMVPHWLVQCALTYDALPEGGVPEGSEERQWIERHATRLREKMQQAEAAGIDVYPWTDFVVIPQSVWKKYGQQMGSIKGKVHGGGGGKNAKPDIRTELTQKVVVAQIDEIFRRFPEADGLVLRFGETYLHDAPHHIGGSPIRDEAVEGQADHVLLMNLLREEICVKRNKKLFYRTWGFSGFHTNPDYYRAVLDRMEPHENLVISIKHQRGDFHRRTPFNPCLGIGAHRQVVEVCCQLDSYGKGAHPYYLGDGVINGWEEYRGSQGKIGIKELIGTGKLAGVYTWSRGGGWDGPYLKNELWSDLNTLVCARWAMDPSKSEEQVFREVASSMGFSGTDLARLREMALLSATAVLKGHCCAAGNVDVWWTRDQYISGLGRKAFAEDLRSLLQKGKAADALAEKRECVVLWERIEQLAQGFSTGSERDREYIRISATYGRIIYSIFEQTWIILFQMLENERGTPVDRVALGVAIARYDVLWQEFKGLKDGSAQCATLYTDEGFRADRAMGIGASVDQARKLLEN